MTTHLEQSLQRDIDLIRAKILEMAGRCEHALRDALQALVEGRRQLAYAVILRDQHIDELEKQIDRLCLEFLVRQQPVAGHLRFAYATIKINAELERIGDYAESVARQCLKLDPLQLHLSYEPFTEIAQLAVDMLRQAVRAFVEQDVNLARSMFVIEDRIDELRRELDTSLVQKHQDDRIPLEALTPLMTISRRFERVSDQAKNICEEVLYMCTGEYAKHQGTGVFRILFVDDTNSCRSQMAEGIAKTLGWPRLVFASASLDPRPLDAQTLRFGAEKGIDLGASTPVGLDQIAQLEQYQVIITLASTAKNAIRPPPKTVCLDWPLPDPSAVEGTAERIQAAYEEVFQHLQLHLRDLAQAIVVEDESRPGRHL